MPKPATSGWGSRRTLLLAVAAGLVVAAALIGASLAFRGGDDDTAPEGSFTGTSPTLESLEGIPQSGTVLGSPDAPVTLLQYEDLQCPVCKQYTDEAFAAIVDEYVRSGKVKVDYRGLAFLGEDSLKGLRIALAAGEQDHLWDVVEALYAAQGEENSGWLTDALVDSILASIPGLDAGQVLADAQSDEIEQQILDVQQEAERRAVQGTPWFYVQIGGEEPYEVRPQQLTPTAFYPILDDALDG